MQVSWFPFLLFDTDWMGREVYHGNPTGSASEVKAYDQGVREGAVGLLLNSVRAQVFMVILIIVIDFSCTEKIKSPGPLFPLSNKYLYLNFFCIFVGCPWCWLFSN